MTRGIATTFVHLSTFLAAMTIASVCHSAESTFSLDEGLRFQSDDGSTEVRLGVRMHLDVVSADEDVSLFDNGMEFRRLRPYVRIRHLDTTFRVSYDISDVNQGIKSLWLQHNMTARLSIRAGNLIAPFGQDNRRASSYLTFLERALPDAFTAGWSSGVMLRYEGDKFTISGGWFGQPIDQASNGRERSGDGVMVRLAGTPYRKSGRLIHLGASVEQKNLSVNSRLRFRARPETRIGSPALVNTRVIEDADSFLNYGLEAGFRAGPFSMLSEYIHSHVNRDIAGDLDFDGWYVQASWILTGERPLYQNSTRSFVGLRPDRKWGALELAVRRSEIDLNNEDVTGGKEENWTIGLNYYLARSVRIMANYIWADARPNRNGVRESAEIFAMRFQFAF